jgi:general secretion pathway protein K
MSARAALPANARQPTPVDAVRPEDRGFVLVSVLWLLALLTLVALALMTAARLDVRAAGQMVRHAEAEALADGLTRLVALRLGDRDRRPLSEARIATDGSPLHCSHQHASVEIAVTDAGGLIDLNAASQPLLEWVLLRRGVASGQARSIAAAIVDFRDADDLPNGPEGAESAAYQAAGLKHAPKNAAFESVTELDQVLGMTPRLLSRLRTVVTVYGRQPGIDAAQAPHELVVSYPEGDSAAAISSGSPAPMPIPSEFRMSSKGLAYRVVVRASTDRGGRFAREAVIEPARTEPLGYRVREWTVAPSDVAPPADPSSENRQPCLQVLL